MRAILCLLFVLPASASLLQAQTDYYAGLGVTLGTALVQDRIVEGIEVRQGLAPTLTLGAGLPITPRYRAGLEAAITSSGYHSKENEGETDLGTLRTGSIVLGLDGPIVSTVRWRAGVGLLTYWPSEEQGIFLRGGTTRFLAGAGVDYRRPIMSKWDLMASLRYDFHRFTTGELRARGFGQNQGVQRISASLGVARGTR